MSRYRPHHEGPNLNKGFYWLFFLAGLTLMVYKIVSCNKAVHRVEQWEKSN